MFMSVNLSNICYDNTELSKSKIKYDFNLPFQSETLLALNE